MAWGNRVDVGWVKFHESSNYRCENYIYYQLDADARKIRVLVDNQRVISKSSRAYYYWRVNNGYQLLGGTNDSQYGRILDVFDTINVPYGGIWTRATTTKAALDQTRAAVYSYNSDGTLSNVVVASQMIMLLPQDNPSYNANTYGFIEQNWISKDISSLLPKLTSTVDAPTGVTVNPDYIGVTGAKVEWVANAKAKSYELTISGGTVQSTVTTTDSFYQFSNLEAGTAYNVTIKSVDADGNKSSGVSISFTTSTQIKEWINDNGTGKKGTIWVNIDGEKKRAIKAWVNVNGEAKQVI
ncbi:fibronectin type III domain-containing protein [Absicoccus intestinalis]|uniref:Fibronectin type III domain-containing protein n=1 Tax=Absicoccus intestinalis TaxID=2926319 RepID=A0ABU4WMA5_9FIRM|nr:hypothetical protein [Absicoccus sp. CLA-KB-P134]MDX8417353.1 fibronectin type III domain-containing protein [Absicoccus sp. CLA-KB-P134]